MPDAPLSFGPANNPDASAWLTAQLGAASVTTEQFQGVIGQGFYGELLSLEDVTIEGVQYAACWVFWWVGLREFIFDVRDYRRMDHLPGAWGAVVCASLADAIKALGNFAASKMID